MQTRQLGGSNLEVSALGLDCTGMNWSYSPPKDEAVKIEGARYPAFHEQLTDR